MVPATEMSSLHWRDWTISLLFCLFSHNGVCLDGLKLSVYDVIVSQNVPMETKSYDSLGRTIMS